jgi:hypothetical protein
MTGRSRREVQRGLADRRDPVQRVVTERVARAAARVVLAANDKRGVESSPKTKRLAAQG